MKTFIQIALAAVGGFLLAHALDRGGFDVRAAAVIGMVALFCLAFYLSLFEGKPRD